VNTFGTVASNGAISWEVSLTLALGSDYSIKIKSSENETNYDSSDAVFTIK
jgi:hypothetical protein